MDNLDDLHDSVGKLSLSAKEWRPGQGFASSSASTSDTTGRQVSASSIVSGSSWNNGEERSGSGQSSWGGKLSCCYDGRMCLRYMTHCWSEHH